MIVNLFGGPGAGKSTTAAGVFALLKLHGVNCELVREYAKEIVWEGIHNRLNNQAHIFAEQLRRQTMLSGQVDVMITDSPILLSLYYHPDLEIVPYFEDYVFDEWERFENICYFLTRTKPYQPIGRRQDEASARSVDEELRVLLNRSCVPYSLATGDQKGISLITQNVLDLLSKPMNYEITDLGFTEGD